MKEFLIMVSTLFFAMAMGATFPDYQSFGAGVDVVLSNWGWLLLSLVCSSIAAFIKEK